MTTTGANRRRISILLGGLLVAIAPGCAEMPHWTPFHGPSSDRVDGVVAPYERVAELRALAAGAGKHGPEEKEKIAKQLAQSIGKEQDPLIRAEIIGALASFPGPTADAILKTGLSDADPQVRIAACEYWGKRNGEQSVELLSQSLHGDIDVDVRLAAAKALGETRNQAAIDSLAAALEDSNPAIQYRAAIALEQVTGKNFDRNVHRWRQYVKGEVPSPQPSIAEQLRRLF
ncbi:MAG: hypothetical protein GX594_00530 [Pirellulaceae bacterium]|nr:hypothetical protein [Pirellulaceae bacterium]